MMSPSLSKWPISKHFERTKPHPKPDEMEFSDANLFHYCLLFLYLSNLPIIFFLQFLQAPYGKHFKSSWGPSVSSKTAWFLMEGPTVWLTFLVFPLGHYRSNPRTLTLISIFLLHYLHRTFIYPLRLPNKSAASRFPISVALMAFSFNLLNAYVQARSVSHYVDYAGETSWWFWGRFLVGLGIFLWGMRVNVGSDRVLLRLKADGKGYRIPRGGWFEVASCANYFGEIVEWFGWAVMTASWAGLGFFLYTCGNLVPRASANHRWYRDKFGEDYPKSRKAVIPFVY